MRERIGPDDGTDDDDEPSPALPPPKAGRRAVGCAAWTAGRFALVLGLCLFTLYPDVVVGGRTFFHRDFGNYSYPLAAYTREAIGRGELPLWNPLSYCGLPFLAQWNTMVLYPGNLFLWLFPLEWSLGVFCLIHAWWGGFGMYRLATRWTGSPTSGACAGFAFALSGLVQQGLMWPSVSATLGWMPWVVLSVERAARKGGSRRLAVAAAAGGVQMLAGTPEFILATWAIATLVAGARTGMSGATRAGLRFVAIAVAVAALAAAQLLPFFELLRLSQRSTGAATLDWSLTFARLPNFLVPLHGLARGVDGVYFDPRQGWLASFSVGVWTLVFGFAVLFFRGPARPQPQVRATVRILAATTVVGVLLALGTQGWILPAVQRLVPGLGLMQFSIKFLVLTTFGLPLLAAFGVRAALASARASTRAALRPVWMLGLLAAASVAILGAISLGTTAAETAQGIPPALLNAGGRFVVLACGFGLLLRMTRPASIASASGLATMLLAGLFALDGWTAMPRNHPAVPMAAYAPQLLAQAADPGLRGTRTPEITTPARGGVMTWTGRALLSQNAYNELMRFRLADPMHACVLKRLALWANWNLIEGVAKVDGFFPLTLAPMDELHGRLFRSSEPRPEGLKDLLGVARETAAASPFEWVSRTSALPLISSGQQLAFGGDETQFRAITAADFKPTAVVWLDQAVRAHYADVTAGQGTVEDVKWAADRVTCEVQHPLPAVLLVIQAYHPAWKALIDGTPAPLHRANFAFQAIRVPAGRHRVELRYQDDALVRGAVISLVAWSVVAVLAGVGGYVNRAFWRGLRRAP